MDTEPELQPTTRATLVEVPALAHMVSVSLDGADPVPGVFDCYPDPAASPFGLAIQWTVTVEGTFGNAFLVPAQHVQLLINYPAGRTVGGRGIVRADSHTGDHTVLYGEGSLSDCLHDEFEDVELAVAATGRVRRLRVCCRCTIFIDRGQVPIRT